MSYDIFFVRRDPGQSFEDALDSTEESYDRGDPGPLTEVELEQWERIVPHARAIFGEIEEFGDDSTRELSSSASGIQLSLFPGEISITVAETPSDQDAVALMEKVYALASAIEAETGLEGYDPQLGEPVSDAARLGAVASASPIAGAGREEQESTSFVSGQRLAPEDFAAEQQAVRPRRRWWEFWK